MDGSGTRKTTCPERSNNGAVCCKESLQSSFDEGSSLVLCTIARFASRRSLPSPERFRGAELSQA